MFWGGSFCGVLEDVLEEVMRWTLNVMYDPHCHPAGTFGQTKGNFFSDLKFWQCVLSTGVFFKDFSHLSDEGL